MAERLGRSPDREASGIGEVTLAHLYRAEVSRSTQWRTRLDTTTNWAITTAAAVVSFTFSSAAAPAVILLVGTGLALTFLGVEARRYRYYDLWARRVRILESGFLGPMLRREPVTHDFYAIFASELVKPRLRISLLDSLTFRLRRTYYPIVALLLGSWLVKLDLHPTRATAFADVVERAHLGPIPGEVIMGGWALVCLAFLALLVRGYRHALPPTELRAPARRQRGPLGQIFGGVAGRSTVRVPHEPMVRRARDPG